MSVREILKAKGSDVVTIDENDSIERATNLMRQRKIGALVVRGEAGIAGILTHREVSEGYAQFGARLAMLTAGDLARREFVAVTPDESTKRLMGLMTRHRVTHVPVLDAGRLAGIVSIGDVVKHRLGDLELEANVLRDAYIAAH
jgi:CBS domain-containing protein